ncbi:MAG: transcriptional repressor [Erysipelotrichaceae bacterium]|nr:transcriptional repressor [Erysipelotrichaceae bacterium]
MNFKDYGLKTTDTRKKILDILNQSKDPLTAEQIYQLLEDSSVNLSTIYRSLNMFHLKGIINKDLRNDKNAVYSLKKERHQHILVCSSCHKKIYLNKCPYELLIQQVLTETGFLIENHSIELYGLCKDCQKKAII